MSEPYDGSAVTAETAETAMSKADAEKIKDRVRNAAERVQGSAEDLWKHVRAAADGRAHEALGFDTFADFMADTLDGLPIGKLLTPKVRGAMVKFLAELGMSTREVAELIGVSQSTASRAGRSAAESHDSDDVLSKFQRERDALDKRLSALDKMLTPDYLAGLTRRMSQTSVETTRATAEQLRDLADRLDAAVSGTAQAAA